MKTNNNITPHVIWKIMLAVFAAGILALALFGCNPVKRVLKDDNKIREVFNEGVKRSWCVNDTVIQSKSDTLITFDTLFAIDFKTDTFTVDREITKVVTKTVTKTVTIKDTVTQTVTDHKLTDLLKEELFGKTEQLVKLQKDIVNLQAEKLSMKKERNKWRLYFWLIVAGITGFILRKPIWFALRKLIGIPI